MLSISIFSLALSTYSLYETRRTNAIKATHDALVAATGNNRFQELSESIRAIVTEDAWEDPRTTYADLTTLHPDAQDVLDQKLWAILNISEAIAVTVNSHEPDLDTSYDFLMPEIIRYYRWGTPYIQAKRQKFHEATLFENLEELAHRREVRARQRRGSLK